MSPSLRRARLPTQMPTHSPVQHLAQILSQGILQQLLVVLQEAAQAPQLRRPELRRPSPPSIEGLPQSVQCDLRGACPAGWGSVHWQFMCLSTFGESFISPRAPGRPPIHISHTLLSHPLQVYPPTLSFVSAPQRP